MFLETAVFRPERDPDTILASVTCAGSSSPETGSPSSFRTLSIGGAALADDQAEPIFERWVGYVCIWVALLSVPAGAIYFPKAGPLVWNGIVAFWIPAIMFVIWVLTMTYALLRAINKQEGTSPVRRTPRLLTGRPRRPDPPRQRVMSWVIRGG
jgi:hypothetical protein